MIEAVYKKMIEQIPNDHSRQVVSSYYLDLLFSQKSEINCILDFGCGRGTSFEYFRNRIDLKWVGLDIEIPHEIQKIRHENGNLCIYDGISFPFTKNYFDLIYTNQVFEHVRYPEQVLCELYRVLRPGGYFVGSTSYLEPYHALSIFNYTPFGFSQLLQDTGFQLVEIRPSIDAISLILYSGLQHNKFLGNWWRQESPLNLVIEHMGKFLQKSAQAVNKVKLQFCGQFCFWAIKPS